MRNWLKKIDELDRDCILRYERLLGRELRNYAEYREIDGHVREMILEFEDKDKFSKAYPYLKKFCVE